MELLVVMMVLTILASIIVPRMLRQTETAKDAEAISHLRNAQSLVEQLFTVSDSYQDAALQLPLEAPSLYTFGNFNLVASATAYEMGVDSRAGGRFTLARTSDQRLVRTCTTPGVGACRAGTGATGWWGNNEPEAGGGAVTPVGGGAATPQAP